LGKRLFPAFIIMLLAVSTAAAQPLMIDSRLMLLAHPLFERFDTETGRFRGTASEYVAGGQEGVDKLIAEIKQLNAWLLNSPKNLQEKLGQVPLPERIAAEREFLAEKREIESRVASLQMRIYNARLVPGRPGVTPEASTLPQINEISSDIRVVLKQLKEKYKTDVVIDSAELLPIIRLQPARSQLLLQNLHSKMFKGQELAENEDFLAWLAEADNYWAERHGLDANVIPVGARDVRLEAIKLVEERTKGLKK
jgi:hypothetical protein